MLGKFDDVALPECSYQLSERTTKVQTKEGIELSATERAIQFVHENWVWHVVRRRLNWCYISVINGKDAKFDIHHSMVGII